MAATNELSRDMLEPRIVELPTQKMAVVHTCGDPDRVMHLVLPALYSSVYRLNCERKRTGQDFHIGPLCARWPNAHSAPREHWLGIWGLPVPEDTVEMPQQARHVEVELETWEYGTVAQARLHGLHNQDGPVVQRLKNYIADHGYEIEGALEEVYLTGPEANAPMTIIRFPVKRAGVQALLIVGEQHLLVLAR